MTDNEIIKALECCGEPKQIGCTHCPVSEDCMNGRLDICTITLDLIKRQQAEVEQWKTLANEGKDKVELLEIEKSALLEQSRSLFDEYEKLRLAAQPYLDEIARECGLNRSKSTALEKVEHNSLCETETYEGGGTNG